MTAYYQGDDSDYDSDDMVYTQIQTDQLTCSVKKKQRDLIVNLQHQCGVTEYQCNLTVL